MIDTEKITEVATKALREAARKAGRPKGTTTLEQKKTKNITLKVTQTARKWFESKPKGWLAAWVEEQARLDQ